MTTNVLDETGQRLSRFLLMQALVNGTYGFVLGLALLCIEVPYPFVWGLLAALFRTLLVWALLVVVALAAGMRIDGSAVDVFGLFALALLVSLAATLWATGVAMRVRSIQGGPAMQIPVFLVLFLAPVYVPLGLLTGWIHAVASVNPATALLEAGRSLIAGDPVHVALAFTAAAALVAVFALWARGGLKSAEAAP